MAGGLGRLQRKNARDFIFQGAAAVAPSTLYIAFHTGDPLDDGSAANELTATGGYTRTLFSAGTTNWNAATTPALDAASIVTNKLAITTAASSGAFSGTASWFSVRTVSTVGDVVSTNFIARGQLLPSQTVSGAGQSISIPAGSASFGQITS